MITLHDFEVCKQVQLDALCRAEHERLLRTFDKALLPQKGPRFGSLLSLLGQWLIVWGEFLQRRYRYA